MVMIPEAEFLQLKSIAQDRKKENPVQEKKHSIEINVMDSVRGGFA